MSFPRGLIFPAFATLAMLAVLTSLGLWQLDRLEWKSGLIERIEARAEGDPVPLSDVRQAWQTGGDVEYFRVTLTGRFLHDHERHLYGLIDGQAGWRILTPMDLHSGEAIIVDRGFVPEPFRDPATRREGLVGGEAIVTALIRTSEEGSFVTPDNQPEANRWFLRDVEALRASLPEALAARTLPYMAEAEPAPTPGGWPRAGVTRLQLPNRHLEYAITWFGMAVALSVVFILYARRFWRGPGNRGDADARIADRDGSV